MANSVARRRHEFGVRMALGASGRDVLALTIRHGAVLTAGGVGLGLAAAGAVLRLMDRSFYGLFSAEPALLMTTAGGLTAVALAATIIPARRATRLDPATVLKE
jgi:ABC-type antimicrobial peptide transport system permease subunit